MFVKKKERGERIISETAISETAVSEIMFTSVGV